MKNVSVLSNNPDPEAKARQGDCCEEKLPVNRKKPWAYMQLRTDCVVANMSKELFLLETLI